MFIDQTGHTIIINELPKRIISLVPSQTELLFDLGLRDEIVGITKFCIHPDEWFRSKTRVGGTKQIKMDIIHQLQPDLILANKEENVKEQIEELRNNYPVWTSDIDDLPSAYDMIGKIGAIIGKKDIADEMVNNIKEKFSTLKPKTINPKTCYLIWREPYMTIGADTFIHSLLSLAGFDNLFRNETRYPETTIDYLTNSGCEVLLLSSEPFPFKQKHVDELQPFLPNTKIILVDGEMFSWYGSRLLKSQKYLESLHKMIDDR